MDETLIAFGGAVKATGDGRISGRLIRYSTTEDADLEGEYFTKSTDFGLEFPAKVGVYYNHGQDPQMGKKRIARAEVKADDEGLFLETQLDLSDRYQAAVYKLAQAGRLGASSGAAAHLVEKEKGEKATEITAWPVAEASLTVTPAEPRNVVIALKSWEGTSLAEATDEQEAAVKAAAQISPLAGEEGKAGVQLSLDDHAEGVASALDGFRPRVLSRNELRAKSGRRHSAATISHFRNVQRAAREVDALITELLESDTAKEADTAQAAEPEVKTPSLRLESLRLQSRLLQEQYAGVIQ